MSTRQLRISGTPKIKKLTPELLGKKINIVFHDGTVMFGEVKEVKENHLTLKNMRLKSKSIPLENILEIYSDTKA